MVYLVVKLLIKLAVRFSAELSEDEVDFVAKVHKIYREHRAQAKPIWR